MSSNTFFNEETIRKDKQQISQLKTIVESAFYSNNTRSVDTLAEAYDIASHQPNVIVLDQEVKHAEELGLPEGAKLLLVNDGPVVGRTASARRIVGKDPQEDTKIIKLALQAVHEGAERPFLKSQAVVGLDEDFMVQAHITMPETQAINLYSWLLNFQPMDEEYSQRYQQSKHYEEPDIYIYFDPDWSHPDYPDGLAYFDNLYNTAIILGMNYFGEIKKGTLSLAWSTASRNKYVACHGGLKIFRQEESSYVASFFGLSGSGKSTLTHAKHEGKYTIEVLHDDAFIISQEDNSSVALEPAYFDKTSDYPYGHPEQDYFVTVQNVGVTLNEQGQRIMVTEDIRNGNGRTVKSRYSTPNRVDKINEPINAIFWIMKDNSLPPLIKVNRPDLASTMGLTLATKRSNAENVKELTDQLVIEPYANPFRLYPLEDDYQNFLDLFEAGVDCYIINTGDYLNKDIGPKETLGVIEGVVDASLEWLDFPYIDDFQYAVVEGYEVPVDDNYYRQILYNRMENRLDYINNFSETKNDRAPDAAVRAMSQILDNLKD